MKIVLIFMSLLVTQMSLAKPPSQDSLKCVNESIAVALKHSIDDRALRLVNMKEFGVQAASVNSTVYEKDNKQVKANIVAVIVTNSHGTTNEIVRVDYEESYDNACQTFSSIILDEQ